MYSIISNNSGSSYGIKTYLVDSTADIVQIPILNTTAPGSMVIVMNSTSRYMLNNNHKWMEIPQASSGGGTNGGNIEGIVLYHGDNLEDGMDEPDVIYDSGSLD
jgi:hypothetical protein